MSLALPINAPEPLNAAEASEGGLDAFITMAVLSLCFHVLLTLYGAQRFSEPPPAWKNPKPLPSIEAELVPPPPPSSPAEAIGEALKAAEDKLPPVNEKLVGSMKADAFKTLLTCRGCTLAGANFKGAYLRLASLQGADMRKAQLAGAELSGTLMNGANLEGADMRGASAAGVNLIGANLKGADLSYARLDAALLFDADFTGAKLVGANFRVIEFVKGVTFRNADARKAIFRHAFLGGVDFRGANLSGADFTKAWGLTNEQLGLACGDATTKLPDGLVIPTCKEQSEGAAPADPEQ
ncbi:MAG: pentapeptide repeat-containing protein [Parvibaculaceae bacterium]